jgi:hypothetical protein
MEGTMTTTNPLDRVDTDHINRVADNAARHMTWRDACVAVLEPGDSTRYEITLARRAGNHVGDDLLPGTGVQANDWLMLASNFGPAYPWRCTDAHHWDYVASHYLHGRQEHTAHVLAAFMERFAATYTTEVEAMDTEVLS